MSIIKRVAPLMFASICMLFGCTMLTEEMPGASGGSSDVLGTIRIELTDAPLLWAEVKEFHVFIERIEVYSYLDEWQTLVEIGKDYDLLKFRNGASATLTVQEIREGNYSGMRMVLGKGNWLFLDDGTMLRRVNLKLARDESAFVALLKNFDIKGKTTSTYVIDFDAEKSLVERNTENPVMDPWVDVKGTETQGKTVFSDDFGAGPGQNDIPDWFEWEQPALDFKCRLEDGSPLGGRLARMYGNNVANVNHFFGKFLDLSGNSRGLLRFQARGSDNWGRYDRVYLEFYYNGVWHNLYTFRKEEWLPVSDAVSINDGDDFSFVKPTQFQRYEIPLAEEMMSTEFWFRFRNGMISKYQYFDVDNVEIFVK